MCFVKLEPPTFGGLRPPNPPMKKIKKNNFYLSMPSFFFLLPLSFLLPLPLSLSLSLSFPLFSSTLLFFRLYEQIVWNDEMRKQFPFFTFCFVIFPPPEAERGRFSSECADSKVFPKWENQTIFRFFFVFCVFEPSQWQIFPTEGVGIESRSQWTPTTS